MIQGSFQSWMVKRMVIRSFLCYFGDLLYLYLNIDSWVLFLNRTMKVDAIYATKAADQLQLLLTFPPYPIHSQWVLWQFCCSLLVEVSCCIPQTPQAAGPDSAAGNVIAQAIHALTQCFLSPTTVKAGMFFQTTLCLFSLSSSLEKQQKTVVSLHFLYSCPPHLQQVFCALPHWVPSYRLLSPHICSLGNLIPLHPWSMTRCSSPWLRYAAQTAQPWAPHLSLPSCLHR